MSSRRFGSSNSAGLSGRMPLLKTWRDALETSPTSLWRRSNGAEALKFPADASRRSKTHSIGSSTWFSLSFEELDRQVELRPTSTERCLGRAEQEPPRGLRFSTGSRCDARAATPRRGSGPGQGFSATPNGRCANAVAPDRSGPRPTRRGHGSQVLSRALATADAPESRREPARLLRRGAQSLYAPPAFSLRRRVDRPDDAAPKSLPAARRWASSCAPRTQRRRPRAPRVPRKRR